MSDPNTDPFAPETASARPCTGCASKGVSLPSPEELDAELQGLDLLEDLPDPESLMEELAALEQEPSGVDLSLLIDLLRQNPGLKMTLGF